MAKRPDTLETLLLALGMLCTNPCVTCLSMGKAQTIST